MYTVIVGASSQIAFEYVKQMADEEYILIDLPEKMESVKLQYSAMGMNKSFVFLGVDICKIPDVKKLFAEIREFVFGKFIILVGTNCLVDALDTTEEIWDKIIDTNLKGCFFIMCEAAKNMIAHSINGSIVNIASQHGVVGNYQRAAYCASKAALLNMNRVLALEWAEFGIRVNSICPTWIQYSHNEHILMEKNFRRKNLKNIPLDRYCKSEDIVYALDYLLSDNSKMMTGQSIFLDGGWTIK